LPALWRSGENAVGTIASVNGLIEFALSCIETNPISNLNVINQVQILSGQAVLKGRGKNYEMSI